MAKHGGDRFLLDTLQNMYKSLQEQVDVIATSKSSSNAVSKEESAETAKEMVDSNFYFYFVFIFVFAKLFSTLE